MKKAIITGITGQDGSYLAELLLSKGYEVHGIVRRTSITAMQRIDHLKPQIINGKLFLHHGDLSTGDTIMELIYNLRPEEIYNLGAQSHVKVSFEIPELTAEVTGVGTLRILESIRKSGQKIRFYQASSSEMFGNAHWPQNELTPFQPQSPYAAAKVFAFWMTHNYREAYDMFAINGILFNHESARRGTTFVTRKISKAIANIINGTQKELILGNLDARRDWGYAPEFVEVMWQLLNLEKPDDFVIGTGETHSIREFLDEAFGYVDLDWRKYVVIDANLFRPTEVNYLCSDPSHARQVLCWTPKITFKQLVRIMVDADLEKIGLPSKGEGRQIVKDCFENWHFWHDQMITMD